MRPVHINCLMQPFNPMPIISAVFAKVASLRAASNAPIYILAGESHRNPVETLLPYAAAHYAGLLDDKSQQSGLTAHLQFACEHPHTTLQERAAFDDLYPEHIKPDASPSVQLALMLAQYGTSNIHDASRTLFTAFAQHDVPLTAIDASIKWGRRLPFLNAKDRLTRRFLPSGKPPYAQGFSAFDNVGMKVRNKLMAHLLHEQRGHTHDITWLNCGHNHLADLANQLQGHVILVANANEPTVVTLPALGRPLILFKNIAGHNMKPEATTPQILHHIKQAALN